MGTDGKEEQTGSEAQALGDILKWSKGCPKWQRDALRRLCADGELDEKDLDDLTALCKKKGKGAVMLAAGHIPDPNAATNVVNLRGIHGVENVNALKQGEHLTFDKAGLTIVYGDNGSGKSGYARILKKVCRARTPKGEKILENIYAPKTLSQKAVVELSVNGQNKTYAWAAAKPDGDAFLSSVSVFDTRTANVHVDEVNDVAYTPFPMRVLEQLAEACQEVKRRLVQEVRHLEGQTPSAVADSGCHDGTAVGRLMALLNADTKEQEVRDLATLTEKEKTRLETLRTDGKKPTSVARHLEVLKARLDSINSTFERLQGAGNDAQVKRLAELRQTYQTTQAAAAAAAEDLFADYPLPNVGSNVWHSLWGAARAYSEREAYPGQSFPVTGDGARCVLCQRDLDSHAAERLLRFERFVKDETKRKEIDAQTEYEEALRQTKDADVLSSDVRTAVDLAGAELEDEGLAKSVRRAAATAKWRLRVILLSHDKGDVAGPFPDAEPWPSEALAAHGANLLERMTALRAEDGSEERKRMLAECEELADREWLALVKEDVLAEISRRRERADLDDALKDTTTNRITIKSGEIAEQLVTNALRAQFSKEIDKFGVAGLAVELRKEKATYGVPRFRVSLIRKPGARAGDILSEGEHRCVALAAFLAELATTEGRSTIVFDDPVSSLDHMHREAVAERLAEEGQHRQIVVLTHDLAFLFLLDQACRSVGTHVGFRCVTRNDDYAGFCQQDPPARALPIGKVIAGMQKQLDNEKILYEKGDHSGWERTVDSLQKRLRDTWERAVEEAVGPVIKRLSNKVQTAGLGKVTAIEMEDCLRMREAYGRCSKLLHTSSGSLNPPLPKPEAIQREIKALQDWADDIKQRQETIAWLQ